MRLANLKATHASYDADTWLRYEALYRGGKDFRANVAKFLSPNPTEPPDVYIQRLGEAAYRSYVGPIVDYFASQLMAAPLTIRASDRESGETVEAFDQFYSDFKEDVDGRGKDLIDLARDAFRTALIKGKCWLIAALPSNGGRAPRTRAEWEASSLGAVRATKLEPEHVLDWEHGEDGSLLWALTYEESRPRSSLTDSRARIRGTWRFYDAETVETFQLSWDPSRDNLTPDTEVPSIGREPHGFARVPLVCIEPPRGLWLMNRVAEAQVEHFRLSAGLGWAIRRTCYAMPVFKLTGGANTGGPQMGAGYFLTIGAQDDVVWAAPPSQPFEVIAKEAKAQKDEIYRVAQQMAQGVENNAAAIGRSAQSKSADTASTEICLVAYGAIVREAIEKLYNLVAQGRGDTVKFRIGGLDRFNLSDPSIAVENAGKAEALAVPSVTFRKELLMSTAEALMPSLSQDKKDAIRREIEEGVTEPAKPAPAPTPPGEEQEDQDDDESAEDEETEADEGEDDGA